MSKSKRKEEVPLRAARVQVNDPEFTIRAMHRSAIGIDVHLHILVCTHLIQRPDGKEYQESRDFLTSRSGLDEFAGWCLEKKPDVILMESTGVLWLSPYEALEEVGFTGEQLALINARDAKAAAGRKTDRKDALRLALLARSGNFKKSFVPPAAFRIQRFLEREVQKNRQDIARVSNRLQKLFAATGCRASTVFSDIHGKAASAIIQAKIDGRPNLRQFVKENKGTVRASVEAIMDALSFKINSSLQAQIMSCKMKLWHLQQYEAETLARLEALQGPYKKQLELLKSIPLIKDRSAKLILAELSDDIGASFTDSEHFCSWLGICPGDNTSAGKQKSGKCPKGNKWIRRVLVECSNSVIHMKDGPLAERYRALKMRRGHTRAVVAIAHLLARIIFSVLKSGEPYKARETTAYQDVVFTRAKRSLRELKKLAATRKAASKVADEIDKEYKVLRGVMGADVGKMSIGSPPPKGATGCQATA